MQRLVNGKIINPATGKPFIEAQPNGQLVELRTQIIRLLKGKYDAAQTTSQNENHWRAADNLSPNAANTLAVRKPLRERSRYECNSNGYLKGIALTLVMDFVGSGPSLQITDTRFSKQQQNLIEQRFNKRYAQKIKLRKKLAQLRLAKLEAGEGFAIANRNESLRHPIKRDYRIFECDQISHVVNFKAKGGNEIDGIRFDRSSGEPIQYHLLNEHPGETELFSMNPFEGRWIPKTQVLHWFRRDRPWLRGIPETTPTLPLWALLRRYTLAVVQNAEITADFTVLLKSMMSPNGALFPMSGTPGQPTDDDPENWFDSFPIDRGLMTVLPYGYDLTQLDPSQPVKMYDEFISALVGEASRPLLVPRNHALANSGGYNMASGALDKQLYRQAINDERRDCDEEILDEIGYYWWYEAIRLPDYWVEDIMNSAGIWDIAQRSPELRDDMPEHTWRWDDIPEHTDPVKVATALDVLFKGGHLSDKDIQEGRFNRSAEEHYENLREQEIARKTIFPDGLPGAKPAAPSKNGSSGNGKPPKKQTQNT